MDIHIAPVFTFRDEASRKELSEWREHIRATKKLIFTNGVFDILHRGHVSYLLEARNLGDALIIGVNADASVRRLKGENRPIQSETDRAHILASLKCADAIVIFDEDTPLELITHVLPDVLVKGSDWDVSNVVGKDIVEANGGKVLTLNFIEGRSTTSIVESITTRYK